MAIQLKLLKVAHGIDHPRHRGSTRLEEQFEDKAQDAGMCEG